MVYKPIICELKCISRDIKKKTSGLEVTSILKEDLQELKNASFYDLGVFTGLIILSLVVGFVLAYLLQLSIVASILFIVGIICFWGYIIIKYILRVHERCIQHANLKKEV